MDHQLVEWARAARMRRKALHGKRAALPPLWLFTDQARLPDPRAAVARLPRGLCGVVLRHDAVSNRAALGTELAKICRLRGNFLVVSGDWRLAARLHAGLHLRGGRRPIYPPGAISVLTSSAHDAVELHRARRAGAGLIFLSPAFATASHPGARTLGAVRWSLLARLAVPRHGTAPTIGAHLVGALGGIDGDRIFLLPRRFCSAAGAIGALSDRFLHANTL